MRKLNITLRKKCPYSALFWSIFSRTQTERGKMQTIITSNRKTFDAVSILELISNKMKAKQKSHSKSFVLVWLLEL